MSFNVWSFFRSNRFHSKEINVKQQEKSPKSISQTKLDVVTTSEDHRSSHLLVHDVNEWITSLNRRQISCNASCCGNDEKRNSKKSQVRAPHLNQENERTDIPKDALFPTDDRIEHIVLQHAVKIDPDRNLNDSFDENGLVKAIAHQLAQRALARQMNSNNDNPPRLCTKKHCSFANEPLSIKPVTCVPGVGRKYGYLCEKRGITMAHQLLSKYMTIGNDKQFEQSLVMEIGFSPKSAAMARDGLKEMRRHLI